MIISLQSDGPPVVRVIGQYLGYAHSEHPVTQLLPHKKSEHLEGRLEPERRRHYQHLL